MFAKFAVNSLYSVYWVYSVYLVYEVIIWLKTSRASAAAHF